MTDVAGVALVALAALSMVGHGLFAAIPRDYRARYHARPGRHRRAA